MLEQNFCGCAKKVTCAQWPGLVFSGINVIFLICGLGGAFVKFDNSCYDMFTQGHFVGDRTAVSIASDSKGHLREFVELDCDSVAPEIQSKCKDVIPPAQATMAWEILTLFGFAGAFVYHIWCWKQREYTALMRKRTIQYMVVLGIMSGVTFICLWVCDVAWASFWDDAAPHTHCSWRWSVGFYCPFFVGLFAVLHPCVFGCIDCGKCCDPDEGKKFEYTHKSPPAVVVVQGPHNTRQAQGVAPARYHLPTSQPIPPQPQLSPATSPAPAQLIPGQGTGASPPTRPMSGRGSFRQPPRTDEVQS